MRQSDSIAAPGGVRKAPGVPPGHRNGTELDTFGKGLIHMSDNELTAALEEVLASFDSEVDGGMGEREYELARGTAEW